MAARPVGWTECGALVNPGVTRSRLGIPMRFPDNRYKGIKIFCSIRSLDPYQGINIRTGTKYFTVGTASLGGPPGLWTSLDGTLNGIPDRCLRFILDYRRMRFFRPWLPQPDGDIFFLCLFQEVKIDRVRRLRYAAQRRMAAHRIRFQRRRKRAAVRTAGAQERHQGHAVGDTRIRAQTFAIHRREQCVMSEQKFKRNLLEFR